MKMKFRECKKTEVHAEVLCLGSMGNSSHYSISSVDMCIPSHFAWSRAMCSCSVVLFYLLNSNSSPASCFWHCERTALLRNKSIRKILLFIYFSKKKKKNSTESRKVSISLTQVSSFTVDNLSNKTFYSQKSFNIQTNITLPHTTRYNYLVVWNPVNPVNLCINVNKNWWSWRQSGCAGFTASWYGGLSVCLNFRMTQNLCCASHESLLDRNTLSPLKIRSS